MEVNPDPDSPHQIHSPNQSGPSQNTKKPRKKRNLSTLEKTKLTEIFKLLDQYNYTPKSFLKAFLENEDIEFAGHRRYWAADRGWDTTQELIHTIRKVISKKSAGKKLWEDFILSEASRITISQKPPSGAYPNGAYHSSRMVSSSLFNQECKDERNADLVKNHMPFLFQLISNKLNARPANKKAATNKDEKKGKKQATDIDDNDPDSDDDVVPEEMFDDQDPQIREECQTTCDFPDATTATNLPTHLHSLHAEYPIKSISF
ncbi:uncharacterized protein PGTG_20805 [Puccinia graminis f. sp. tritici CRL 75-36-700-3]|uniref:Uncharacterized protein n=1 Tax=Puccinia graminis f. sp. tritici (strain CRL 75-36-700-3 / race SCCL) TaxID=418459 RepID=H6QPQ1_PUCGT|nr:uncharacterized protein PGTG_20805 [Puccinia graminis f. sp. tritici CRL 75-36-700-3]EHS64103.1 hypothetical protein PGTG_20805 [Puccinia graminis f. sp. tritici CRL 75-36-700-3]